MNSYVPIEQTQHEKECDCGVIITNRNMKQRGYTQHAWIPPTYLHLVLGTHCHKPQKYEQEANIQVS